MDYQEYIRKNKINLSKKSDPAFDLANLITEARLFAGFSQSQLAKAMGTTQSSIARAEGGQLKPSIDFLERVAKAVGTNLIYPKFSFMVEREKKAAANTYASVRASGPNHVAISSHLTYRFNGATRTEDFFISPKVRELA